MAGVTLYDTATGKPTSVDADAAQNAVLGGALTPKNDQRVHVVLKDGRKGTVEGHQLASTLAEGAHIVDPEAERHAALLAAEEGPVGALLAAPMQAFEGATGGLGPGFIRKGIGALSPSAGNKFQEMTEIQNEAHPITRVVSNLAGAATAAYASKGQGAVSGLARFAPAAIADAAGGALEARTAGALAGIGGRGLLATAGRAAGTAAVRGAAETALFSAGQQIGEDMLGDRELAAEKVFVAGAKGGLLGLGAGAVLGGAGSLVKSGKNAAMRGLKDLLHGKADDLTAEAADKVAVAKAEVPVSAKEYIKEGIEVGPSSHFNPEAYPNPYRVKLDASDYVQAPEATNPFKITKEGQPFTLDPNAGLSESSPAGTRMIESTGDVPQFPGTSAGRRQAIQAGLEGQTMMGADPWLQESTAPIGENVFGIRKGHGVNFKPGIEGLEAPKGTKAIGIETDKGVLDANARLARGEVPVEAARPIGPAAQRRMEAEAAAAAQIEKATSEAAKLTEEAVQLRKAAKDPSLAADMFWANTKASKKFTARVAAKEGGLQGIFDTAIKQGIVDTGGESGALASGAKSFLNNTPEKMLDRANLAAERLTDQIISTVHAAKATTTMGEILAPMEKQIAELRKTGVTEGAANSIATIRQNILGAHGLLGLDGLPVPGAASKPVSIQDLVETRRALQGRVYEVGNPDATLLKRAARDTTFAWRNLEDSVFESMGKGAGAEFRALNKEASQVYDLRRALDERVIQLNQSNQISIGDKFAIGAGLAMGHAGPGGIIGGVVAGLINKKIREGGNVAAAVALNKIGNIGMLKDFVGTADKAVERAAKGLTSTEKAKLRVVSGSAKMPEEKQPVATRYRDAIKQLDQLQGSDFLGNTMRSTQDIAQHAPETSQAFMTTASRALSFLASKRPAGLEDKPSMYADLEPSVLPTDKAQFLRYFKATTDPMSVLADFERGVVTPEASEALKATAPKLFQQLQEKTMEQVAERRAAGKPLPFKKRMELGLLFDIPTDPSLEKDTYKLLQQNVAQEPPPQQPPSGGGKSNAPRRPVKINNGVSQLDKLASMGAGRK